MATPPCETCKFRAKYDNNPTSFLGRLWRWHAGWCPGFRSYLMGMEEGRRKEIAGKYGMKKYM